MNKFIHVEILRFLAALSVLVFHYRFFIPSSEQSIENLPFNNSLGIIYTLGASGVWIFWSISGYIFYHVYKNKIMEKNVNLKKFFINRFSRLYPLHFLTLVIVALLQIIHLNIFEEFHYNFLNDIYHFILNLFFVSDWGFEKYHSFNGPIWSVSIEIIVYFGFFFSIFYFKKPFIISLNVIFICALIKIFSDATYKLLDCLIFFFAGGATYIISNYLDNKKIKIFQHKAYYILLLIMPYLFWETELYEVKYSIYLFFLSYSSMLLVCGNINVTLHKKFKKVIENLGNLSYGIYLLHFPVAILIQLIFHLFKLKIPFQSSLFFLFYLFLVVGISYISFFKFEKPIQNFIRNKLQ